MHYCMVFPDMYHLPKVCMLQLFLHLQLMAA